VPRTFAIYGTGHKHEHVEGTYIGTFQLDGGSLVFHVFEECGSAGTQPTTGKGSAR